MIRIPGDDVIVSFCLKHRLKLTVGYWKDRPIVNFNLNNQLIAMATFIESDSFLSYSGERQIMLDTIIKPMLKYLKPLEQEHIISMDFANLWIHENSFVIDIIEII